MVLPPPKCLCFVFDDSPCIYQPNCFINKLRFQVTTNGEFKEFNANYYKTDVIAPLDNKISSQTATVYKLI